MKNQNRNLFFALAVFACASVSCDKIQAPYTEEVGVNNDTAVYLRKVLVEDYTGHTCGNCPAAAKSAEQIKQLYGKKAVVVAVHAGFYAQPKNYPDGSYASDYRTTAGNDYTTYFGIEAAGLPNGMINRKSVNSSRVISHPNWTSMVQGIVNLPPDAAITLTNTYDSISRNVNCIVQVKYLKTLPSALRLVICVTEDSIVNWQKDYTLPSPSNIPAYLHRHMLRGAMNGSWGDTLSAGLPGATASKIYSFNLNAAWKAKHCSVVAFLYNAASYEVIQAEEKQVTKK